MARSLKLQYCILSLLVLLINVNILSQDNLVTTNGGFELGTSESWDLLTLGTSQADFTVINNNQHEGSYCLQVDVIALGPDSWSIQLKKNGWAVEEGHQYEASIWAKSATNGSQINFTIGKYTDPYTEYSANYGVNVSTSWQKFSKIFESPVTTIDDITLALHVTDDDIFWFDDFRVVELINEVIGAVVSGSGKIIEIEFFEDIQDPSQELQLPFRVYNQNNVEKSIGSITQNSTAPKKIILHLDDLVIKNETITIEYTPGTLATETGREIGAFTAVAVNNSTYMPTTVHQQTGMSNTGVYPNPAKDIIHIQTDGQIDFVQYKITDLSGKSLQSGSANDQTDFSLNIDRLGSGFYLLIVTDKMQNSVVHKFLKK
jgi:hypothetical protein